MNFKEAVWALLPTIDLPGCGPTILLYDLEDYYNTIIYIRKNGSSEYSTEQLHQLESEIREKLVNYGYRENGEIINASRIHENMSSLFNDSCPSLILKNKKPFDEGTWGGMMSSDLFFKIWENPEKVYETCDGNSDAAIVWAAYFYLLGIGESSVNFGRNTEKLDEVEKGYLLKAELLCPEAEWILDAKNQIKTLKSLIQQEQEYYKIKNQPNSHNNFLWIILYGFAGYIIGNSFGLGAFGLIAGILVFLLRRLSKE